MASVTSAPGPGAVTAEVRRCADDDWRDVRRLHIKLALSFPPVIDVDLNEVLAIPHDYWVHFVRTGSRSEEQALFVAVIGGGCVGMGHVHHHAASAQLSMLYVDADRRRQGVGTALVRALMQWVNPSGATALLGHIPVASAAGPLAHQLGWRKSEEASFTTHGIEEHKWTWRS